MRPTHCGSTGRPFVKRGQSELTTGVHTKKTYSFCGFAPLGCTVSLSWLVTRAHTVGQMTNLSATPSQSVAVHERRASSLLVHELSNSDGHEALAMKHLWIQRTPIQEARGFCLNRFQVSVSTSNRSSIYGALVAPEKARDDDS